MTEMNPDPAPTTEKIVPQMHDAYYKARKLFVFFSLLLFINEWVGIINISFTDVSITDFIKKVSFMGVEINVENLKLKIDSSVLVWAVWGYLILWSYSFARYYIEWSQVDSKRRTGNASKWDFQLTIFTAIFALSVWLIQRILRVQLANVPLEFLLPFLVGLFVPLIFNFRERSKQVQVNEKRRRGYNIKFIALCITAPVLTVVYLIYFINSISFIAILSLIGAFIIGMIKNALDGVTPFSSSSTTTPGAPSDPPIGSVTNEATDENNKSETTNPKQIKKQKSKGPKQKKVSDRKTS